MSELEAIAAKLRELAEDSGRLSGQVETSSIRLRALAGEVDGIRRSGVDVGNLHGAVQAALANAVRAGEAVRQVKAQGTQWADELAGSGGGTGGAGGGTSASGQGGQGRASGRSPKPVQTVDDVRGWLHEINPGYTGEPWDPRSSNCGSCALAVFDRLAGAGTSSAGTWTLSTPEMESSTGRRQITMSPADIEQRLRASGPGSHAVVGVDRAVGPGHWFNAYFDGTDVVAIDGQTGMISGWPPDYGNVVLWDAGL